MIIDNGQWTIENEKRQEKQVEAQWEEAIIDNEQLAMSNEEQGEWRIKT